MATGLSSFAAFCSVYVYQLKKSSEFAFVKKIAANANAVVINFIVLCYFVIMSGIFIF